MSAIDRDAPRVLAGVLEPDLDRAGIGARHPLGPLDRQDAVGGERVEAEIVDLARRQPIEIDVDTAAGGRGIPAPA